MKLVHLAFAFAVFTSSWCVAVQSAPARELPQLANPMSEGFLKANLRARSPRLLLTPEIEINLRRRLKIDPVVQNVYKAIRMNATVIQTKPVVQREFLGRRMLSVSREVLYRMNILGIAYRIDRDPKVLERINDELTAVCDFTDWNPPHFLDVAEMSLAVAIGLDWTAGDLPKATIEMAQQALIEKGLRPSFDRRNGWQTSVNNWNQVCHGGMVAAAIAVAERDPGLSSKTIARALDKMPLALHEYGPDGMYPEGASYWGYGTGYSAITSSILESAFGTDFGMAHCPGFKESAIFRKLMDAPSGWFYNFGDCADRREPNGDFVLLWFATKTGVESFVEKDRFLRPADEMGTLSRFAGVGLVWLSQFQERRAVELPTAWKANGINPAVVFTGGRKDPRQYYFGGKGGRASISHGNMDAGSFIFELDGVRWSLELGKQDYHAVERTGFDLWGSGQDADRWKLLTKNNFGHSTITVNDQHHRVDETATIINFKNGVRPEATIDLTPVYGGLLKSAQRRFVKDGPNSILIEDDLKLSKLTEQIVWQMLTQSEVTIEDGRAVLREQGKSLTLTNLSHPDVRLAVVSLDPPPLKLDRIWPDLKRIELRLAAQDFDKREGQIRIRLSGD